MKSTTHLAFAFVFGMFAFCFGVFIIAIGQVEGWDTIPWWVPLCELVLGFVTWSRYQEFKKEQVIEQNLTKQVVELDDTKEIDTRTIIQIAINNDNNLYALCTDGTVWVQTSSIRHPEWVRLSGIPK